MGSMLKADSERRELVRERRQARIARKQERRDAREHKRAQMSASPAAASPIQRAAQEQVDAELDRIVNEALERHDRDTATANTPHPTSGGEATRTMDERAPGEEHAGPAQAPAGSPTASASAGQRVTIEAAPVARVAERASRRERDIAAFRERRRQAADEARAEARERIARAGELASVADALAALEHSGARAWDAERAGARAGTAGRSDRRGWSGRPAVVCGRSAAMRRAARAERGAIRTSRSRRASRTRSSRACRAARCAARSEPARRCLARAVRQRAFWR